MALDAVDAADLRTLAWARPLLTGSLLDRYLDYQRTLVEGLSMRSGKHKDRAHRDALDRSGLAPHQLGSVAAVCREFAGKRATAQRIRRRMDEVMAQGDTARHRDLETQLARLTEPHYWTARYGEETLQLMLEREGPLVELHVALQTLELP